MRAASSGQKESVLLLLENGANPTVTNDVSVILYELCVYVIVRFIIDSQLIFLHNQFFIYWKDFSNCICFIVFLHSGIVLLFLMLKTEDIMKLLKSSESTQV